MIESMATLMVHAERSIASGSRRSLPQTKEVYYCTSHQVLVSYGNALNKTSEWTVFQAVYYGPCIVVQRTTRSTLLHNIVDATAVRKFTLRS